MALCSSDALPDDALDPSCHGNESVLIDADLEDAPTEFPEIEVAKKRRARRKKLEDAARAIGNQMTGDMESAFELKLQTLKADIVEMVDAKLREKPAWFDELIAKLVAVNKEQFAEAASALTDRVDEMASDWDRRFEDMAVVKRRFAKRFRELENETVTAYKRLADVDLAMKSARSMFDESMAGIREELNENEWNIKQLEFRLVMEDETAFHNLVQAHEKNEAYDAYEQTCK